MGISTDLLIQSPQTERIHEELQCSICQDVLEDPQMVEPCEHAFCGLCLHQWRADSNTCPVDRQQIRRLTRMQGPFLRMLNGLQIHCPFKGRGCNATVNLGDKRDHERRCEFNRRDCTKGCGSVLSPSQREGHDCMAYLQQLLRAKNEEASSMTAEIKTCKDELQGKVEEFRATRANVQKVEKDVQAKLQIIDRMEAELTVKEGIITSLQDSAKIQVAEAEQWKMQDAALRATIKAKDTLLARMEADIQLARAEMQEKNDILHQMDEHLKKKDLELGFRDAKLENLAAELQDRNEELVLCKNHFSQSQEMVRTTDENLQAKEEELEQTLEKLHTVIDELGRLRVECTTKTDESTTKQRGGGGTIFRAPSDGETDTEEEENDELHNAEIVCVKNMQDSSGFVEQIQTILAEIFRHHRGQVPTWTPAELSLIIRIELSRTRHLLAWKVHVAKCEKQIDIDTNEVYQKLSKRSILLFRVSGSLFVSIAY